MGKIFWVLALAIAAGAMRAGWAAGDGPRAFLAGGMLEPSDRANRDTVYLTPDGRQLLRSFPELPGAQIKRGLVFAIGSELCIEGEAVVGARWGGADDCCCPR